MSRERSRYSRSTIYANSGIYVPAGVTCTFVSAITASGGVTGNVTGNISGGTVAGLNNLSLDIKTAIHSATTNVLAFGGLNVLNGATATVYSQLPPLTAGNHEKIIRVQVDNVTKSCVVSCDTASCYLGASTGTKAVLGSKGAIIDLLLDATNKRARIITSSGTVTVA